MFRKLRAWYDGAVARALAAQERKLREDLEETKRLPRTPERDKLIAETEAFLADGSPEANDRMLGAKIDATSTDLASLRTQIAIDQARSERKRLAERVSELNNLSKRR